MHIKIKIKMVKGNRKLYIIIYSTLFTSHNFSSYVNQQLYTQFIFIIQVNNNQLKTNIFKFSDFLKLVQSKLNHTKRLNVIYIFNSYNDLL